MNTQEQHELRQSMWSIRPTLVGVYFAIFTVAVIAGEAFVVWREVKHVTSDDAPETMIGIIQGAGWVGLASAINAFILTEILENAMVMGNWLRQTYLEPLKARQREEGRVKGVKEGYELGVERGIERGRAAEREELLAEMREWDLRRREADVRGEPFDEPPPYAENGRDDGQG